MKILDMNDVTLSYFMFDLKNHEASIYLCNCFKTPNQIHCYFTRNLPDVEHSFAWTNLRSMSLFIYVKYSMKFQKLFI